MAQRYSAPATVTRPKPGKSVSSAVVALGLGAPLVAVAGALIANRGIASPFTGFLIFASAIPLSLLAVVLSLGAFFRARGGRNRAAKLKAFGGLTLAALTLAAVAGLASPGANYPRINDITTDTADPPDFVANLKLQRRLGASMAYPAEFGPIQRQAYPTISTRTAEVPPDQAFKRLREALESLPNVRVTYASVKEGRIEAIAVSRVFRFVDDVVVRIRPDPVGSRIDVRSRSRDGKGDMGVNAQRIETILAALR
jgi:uncharacterized protein (DUF1499 family)